MQKILLITFLLICSVFYCILPLEVSLNEKLIKDGKASIIVHFKGTFNRSPLEKINDVDIRAEVVVDSLRSFASSRQRKVQNYLKVNNIPFYELWITNSLHIENADMGIVKYLRSQPEVEVVIIDEKMVFDKPVRIEPAEKSQSGIQWNVQWVKADALWKNGGKTGEGITLAIADDGVDYKHPILEKAYRGYQGDNYNHNHNWYDPGRGSKAPTTYGSHGTHVMGIALGADGYGIAPAAKWIGCVVDGGVASNFVKCCQFFVAPFDSNGENPKPELRPHVVSLSYTGTDARAEEAINSLISVGILFVKSAGNSGPSCKTITVPGRYENATAIASLKPQSNIASSYSSRGPSDLLVKPNFAVPGEQILSSVPRGGYEKMSGTSMAAPNFNGCVGLLWSNCPRLARKIRETLGVIANTALRQTTTDCQSQGVPNNVYGFGTVNIDAAYEEAKKKGLC